MKLSKLVGLLLLMLFFLPSFGQDILFKRNGTKDSVKVQEITPTEIVYKKFNRPTGPLYRISKFDIALIEFEDGTVEVIEAEQPKPTIADEEARKKEAFVKSLGANIISVNYMALFVGNVYVGYERIFNKYVGLKITLNKHLNGVETDILGYDRLFTAGLDLNFYPTGQGKIKYFLGPAIRVGTWKDNFSSFQQFPFEPQNQEYRAFSFYFNNGFYMQPTKSFFMSFQAGFGAAFLKSLGSSSRLHSEPDGIFAFNMGYRL